MSNLKLRVGCPQRPIGAKVISYAGTFITDTCPQHLLDSPVKTPYFPR